MTDQWPNSGQNPTCAPPLPHDRFEIEITIFDVDFTQNREMSTGTQIPNPFECDNRFLISILRNFEIDFTLKSQKRSKTSIDLSRVRGLTADVPLRAYTHQVCAVWFVSWGRFTWVFKLTWLVLGEDPAARSHRVEQFTALWGL